MICLKCGYDSPQNSRFCENCGAALNLYPANQGAAFSQGGNPGVAGKANTYPPQQPKKPWGWTVLILVVILGCLCVAGIGVGFLVLRSQNGSLFTKVLESQTAAPADPIYTPLPQAETPAAQGETPPAKPGIPPNTLLITTTSGIFAVNEQTHEATQISNAPLDSPWDLNEGMSPDKKFFAYLTGWGGASVNPMLVVLDIEKQTSILQLELTGPGTQPGMEGEVGDPAFEALRAMQLSGSVAWSPDGTRLAFISGQEGDSADVYLFNRSDNSVTRLTQEAGHAFGLHWSPDGQLLAYLSANSFGTGAGSEMESLWAYDFQDNQSQLLENLESGGEEFLAWTDNEHFLISSWSSICESYNLRLVNAARSFNEGIVEGCFSGIAYDPAQKHGLFAVTEFNDENCSCGEALDQGLMIFGENIGYPAAGEIGYKKFELLDAYTVSFVPQGNLFVIYGWDGQQFVFDDKVANMEIPEEVYQLTPYASPTGEHWAWASRSKSGLWVTLKRNMNPVELSAVFSGVPLWSRDGQTLYFFENNRLFSASAPQFSSKTLITEINGAEILALIN